MKKKLSMAPFQYWTGSLANVFYNQLLEDKKVIRYDRYFNPVFLTDNKKRGYKIKTENRKITYIKRMF